MLAQSSAEVRFGMARETGRGLNIAIKTGIKKGYGIGRSVGKFIYKEQIQV